MHTRRGFGTTGLVMLVPSTETVVAAREGRPDSLILLQIGLAFDKGSCPERQKVGWESVSRGDPEEASGRTIGLSVAGLRINCLGIASITRSSFRDRQDESFAGSTARTAFIG